MQKYSKTRTYIKYLIPIVLLAFVFICSKIPTLAESYMQHVYPVLATVLSFISGLVSFSLLDVLIILVIIALTVSIVLMLRRKISFRSWAKVVILSLLWLPVWFYLAWGIGYFRPDFFSRVGVERQPPDKDFFEAFVERYIDKLNQTYPDDKEFDVTDIDQTIEQIYKQRHTQLHLPYPCGKRRTKYTLTESLMTQVGVAGYFDPFFNEVQVNNFNLPESYPFILAHEKAHQLGIASEAECNFYASVICTASDHPLVRYSGYLETVSYLLGNLRKLSPDKYAGIYEKIDPRIIADYRKIREHWQQGLQPTLSGMQDKVYDTYLKTNKQQSGIRSYSEMVELLVAWEEAI